MQFYRFEAPISLVVTIFLPTPLDLRVSEVGRSVLDVHVTARYEPLYHTTRVHTVSYYYTY